MRFISSFKFIRVIGIANWGNLSFQAIIIDLFVCLFSFVADIATEMWYWHTSKVITKKQIFQSTIKRATVQPVSIFQMQASSTIMSM